VPAQPVMKAAIVTKSERVKSVFFINILLTNIY